VSGDRVVAWVVIAGAHPLDELTLYGPFEDADAAEDWANVNVAGVGDWWLREVCGAE
jgi:hypothetical protein